MASTNWVDCDLQAIPLSDILRALMTLDATGCVALRTVQVVDSGDDAVDCANQAQTEEQLLRNLITVDGSGKPAIRLAITLLP